MTYRSILSLVIYLEDKVSYNMIWCDAMWYDVMWCDLMWCDIWYGMVWYVMVWYGMAWHGMAWYMMWYYVILYYIILYHVMSHHISYHITYHIISCHIVEYSEVTPMLSCETEASVTNGQHTTVCIYETLYAVCHGQFPRKMDWDGRLQKIVGDYQSK